MKTILAILLTIICFTADAQCHYYDTSRVVISIPSQRVKVATQGAGGDSIQVSVCFLVIDTIGNKLLTLKVKQIYKEPTPLPANFPTDIATKAFLWTQQVFPTLKATPKTQ